MYQWWQEITSDFLGGPTAATLFHVANTYIKEVLSVIGWLQPREYARSSPPWYHLWYDFNGISWNPYSWGLVRKKIRYYILPHVKKIGPGFRKKLEDLVCWTLYNIVVIPIMMSGITDTLSQILTISVRKVAMRDLCGTFWWWHTDSVSQNGCQYTFPEQEFLFNISGEIFQ